MAIERSARRVGAARLDALARSLLDASTLCAISTVAPRGEAYVNTAYFAWSERFELVWLSEPHARHSRNLAARPTAAVAVFDSRQSWGKPDRGIQLFGAAREVAGSAARDAERTYASRFPDVAGAALGGYRFYRFRPRRVKLFDEAALGTGVFVTAGVSRGGLTWLRTERYDASRP
jgi:uncharacterized protein YhbP (UPF0306 family)